MLQLFLFASLAIAQTSVTSIVSTSPPTTTPTNTQSYNSVLINGTLETFRVLSTLSPSIGNFPPLLPNVQDPKAVDAQVVCPGYLASNVVTSNHGLQASLQLAGPPCNVYGTDIAALVLSVEYQNDTRLAIKISPSIIVRPSIHHTLHRLSTL
jgi:alpha-glucosidase